MNRSIASQAPRHALAAVCALLLLSLLQGPAMAREKGAAPPGDSATTGAKVPYTQTGIIDRIDTVHHRIVIGGTSYRYHHPVVHRAPQAPGNEDRNYRPPHLRVGMRIGFRAGRIGDPPAVLEVWLLQQ